MAIKKLLRNICSVRVDSLNVSVHNYSKFWRSEVDSGAKELESYYFPIPQLPGAHQWKPPTNKEAESVLT